MNSESIETVLTEVCEEIKSLKQLAEKQKAELENLSSDIKTFDGRLSEMRVTALPTNFTPIEGKLNDWFIKTQFILESYPKKIHREFHFHFFPKINIMEYYRTYSKLVLYFSLLLSIAGLFTIGQRWIEGYNERQQLIQIHSFESNQKPVQSIEKTMKRKNK